MNIPRAVVENAISEILETMYFMSPSYRGEATPELDTFGVAITFSGPIRGQFTLGISRRLAGRMTSEFLACDEASLEPQQIEAAVWELANVVCGISMSAWMPEANFEYGVPVRANLPLEPVTHTFSVDADQPEMYLCVNTFR